MQQLESIQFLRGASTFAIMLFHICALSKDYSDGVLFAPFLIVFHFCVDVFFVVSGFVMTATTYNKFDEPGASSKFAIQRLSRIYPPYWALSIILLAYYLWNPSAVNAKSGGVDVLSSFLLTPATVLPLIPVAWTLVHEVIFYTIFYFAVCFLPHRYLDRALVIWAVLVAINITISGVFPGRELSTYILHPFNLEFIAGALLGLSYRRRGAIPQGQRIALIAASLAILTGVAIYFQSRQLIDIVANPLRVYLLGVPSILLVAGCIGFNFTRNGVIGALTRMGDYSYSLYLIHILIIHFGYRIATRRLDISFSFWTNIAFGILLSFVCIVVGRLFYRYVEKPSCAASLRFMTDILDKKRLSSA